MVGSLNETNKYILESIHTWVWSGFYSPDEVNDMIGDILEEDADEAMLRAAVAPEFERKMNAEKEWPKVTDFDRLTDVFAALNKRGVLCLHNAGYTMSEGHEDAIEMLADQPKDKFLGYCFYHEQDIEQAVHGQGLMLAFEHVPGGDHDKLKVGIAVKEELERAGFAVTWDGGTETRIHIPNFDWKHRRMPLDVCDFPCRWI